MLRSLFALALFLPLAAAADPPKAEAKAPSFVGTWETTFGPMTLAEKDGKLSGYYQTGSQKNEITGTVKDRTFTFTYTEPGVTGEGEFVLAADGASFTGKWRPEGAGEWGVWTGTRPKSLDFDGLWRGRTGPIRLTQRGDKVRGTYSWGGMAGTIEGTAKGKTLTFTYTEQNAKGTTGSGTFTLADDAGSLSGTWKETGGAAEQPWPTVKRVKPQPGKRWLYVIEQNWESSLNEKEYAFGSMLKAFFAGSEQVEVRHRWFTDTASLQKWLREVVYVAEPVVVVVSSHGSEKGPNAGKGTATAKEIAAAVRGASNIQLLHFAACEVMKGTFADDLYKELGPDATFPVSGYTTCVDWAGSAVSEFLFYDFLLNRGMDPDAAMKKLIKAMPYVGDTAKDSPIAALGMKLKSPAIDKGRER
jgi:hypothetical protein